MSSVCPGTAVWRRTSCPWRRQPQSATPAIPVRSSAASKLSPTQPGPGQNPAVSSRVSRSAPGGETHATSSPISRAVAANISTRKSTPPVGRPRTTSRPGKRISHQTGRRARRRTPIRCAFAGLTRPHRGHGPGSLLHGCACWLWWTLRAACPKRSPWRRAQFDTLRLRLVKLAATVVEKKTRILVTLPASCPRKGLLRFLFDALAPPRPAKTSLTQTPRQP